MTTPIQDAWLRQPAAQAASIPAFIAACAQRYGAALAFSGEGHSLDYRGFDRLADAAAAWLRHGAGLAQGGRVALLLPNLLAFPVLALGVLRAGLVLVNLNPRASAQELQHALQDSGASLVAALPEHVPTLTALAAVTQLSRVVLLAPAPAPDLAAVSGPDSRGKLCVSRWQQVLSLGADLLRRHGRCFPALQRDATALLQYTGGTTGAPKAAQLSHGNLLANVAQLGAALGRSQPPPGATMVLPLPLYHCYSFTLGLMAGLASGHHLLLIPDPRDPQAMLRAMQPWRINGLLGIDTLYRGLCAQPALAQSDWSGLQLCSAGGMALSPQVAADWLRLTASPLVEGYGLSECAPLVACNTPLDLVAGTVGRPVPGTRLRLLAADGLEVAAGEPGEICVQGPQLMRGYWQQPVATAQVFDRQGWFHTGDIGVLDSGGRLRIVDRLKDLVIVSGFKVYPAEVEAQVCLHPQVREACLVGVEQGNTTRLVLFVVARGTAPSAQALIDWCRRRLAPYKVPRQVEFRSQLPLSHVGKVLRRELRAACAAELSFSV